MYKTSKVAGVIVLLLIFMAGCGGEQGQESASDAENEETEQELSDFEMEHGIGPITEPVEIEELDPEMVEKGKQIFETKCASCHKMEGNYVGPPLGGVANSRSPAFLMNMMLNPGEMISEHPIGQSLLQEYTVPMTDQNLTEEDARAVTEYLIDQTRN